MTESIDVRPSEAAASSGALSPRDRTVISVLLVATFVVILNETIMAVALPVLMTDLGVLPSVGQWLTAGFLLTMSVIIPITGFLIRRVPTRALFGTAMGLFSLGTLIAALAPGFGVLLAAQGRPGQRHGDHAAAVDDHRDDARAARPSGRGHGQPVDRHLGGARGRAHGVRGRAVVPGLAGDVPGRAAHRARHAGARPASDGRHRRAHPHADRRAVGRAVGRRLRRPRLRAELDRCGQARAPRSRPGCRSSSAGSASSRSSDASSWLQRTDRALLDLRTFRSRTFTMASVIMMLMMATLLGSLTLLPIYMQNVLHLTPLVHRPAAAAGWPGDGSARAGRRAALRPARRAGAARARHRGHQPGAVVEHVVLRRQPGLVRPGLPRAAVGRAGVRLHPAVHRRAGRGGAEAVLLRQRDLRVHPAARRARPGWRCWSAC